MARKRNAYTRARDKRTRPKTPAPTDGLLIHDIARLTAIPVRTLRDYVQRGLLRHSALRGTLTRYPLCEVRRFVAALRLKAQSKTTWAETKRKVDAFSALELNAWLAQQELPPALAAELGIARPKDASIPSPAPQNMIPLQLTGESWYRITLLPGLELFLSSTASPLVTNAARRLLGL
jgi:hypothetical protein